MSVVAAVVRHGMGTDKGVREKPLECGRVASINLSRVDIGFRVRGAVPLVSVITMHTVLPAHIRPFMLPCRSVRRVGRRCYTAPRQRRSVGVDPAPVLTCGSRVADGFREGNGSDVQIRHDQVLPF